jgi:AhpD family alkylhydroperoxidase
MPAMRPPVLSFHAVRSLGRALVRWPAAHGRGLDPALRERIILHVSAVNACDVCTAFHVRAAEGAGLAGDDIAAACALDLAPRDERTRLALHYAELRTLGLDDAPAHAGAVAAFERHYDAGEQAAIRATVDLFTFNNRFNNTWDRLPGAGVVRRLLIDRVARR